MQPEVKHAGYESKLRRSSSRLLGVLTFALLLETNSYMDMAGCTNYLIRHEKGCVP